MPILSSYGPRCSNGRGEGREKDDDLKLGEGISVLHGYLTLAVTTGKKWAKGGMWHKYTSVGMVCNVEGLRRCSTVFSTAFILALGCKPVHLQKGMMA